MSVVNAAGFHRQPLFPNGLTVTPIVHKFLILTVAGMLVLDGSIDWWQMLLVAMRDSVVILLATATVWRHGTYPMQTAPLVIGQIATIAQISFLLSVLLIPQAQIVFFLLAIAVSGLAAFAYLYDFITQWRNLETA